jgi:xanthine dehydrogenase accessory factor
VASEIYASAVTAGIANMMVGDTQDVLQTWQADTDSDNWAMAIIYRTDGHSYRKTGVFTLVSDSGRQLGVLSGGCLEADIRLMGQKCLGLNKVLTKEYDGRDDEDISYQLGCGGIVWIAFIPLTNGNGKLALDRVLERLTQHQTIDYALQFNEKQSDPNSVLVKVESDSDKGLFNTEPPNGGIRLNITIKPKPHLLVIGGGKDAIPVCHFAKQLGWFVSVWDPRGAYGRPEDFADADANLSVEKQQLTAYADDSNVQYSVLMSHNVDIDASALKYLSSAKLKHIALLGPKNRFRDVVKASGINLNVIHPELSGPAGLDIGGDLPSSIALSIVAKFHALEHGKPV